MLSTKHATLLAGVVLLVAVAAPATAGGFSVGFHYGNGGWHFRGHCAPTSWYAAVRCNLPIVGRGYDSEILCDRTVYPGRYYGDYFTRSAVVYDDDYDSGIVYDTDIVPSRYYGDPIPRRTVTYSSGYVASPPVVYSDDYFSEPAVVYTDPLPRPMIVYNRYVPSYRPVTRTIQRRTVYRTRSLYCEPPAVARRHISDRDVHLRRSYVPRTYTSRDIRVHNSYTPRTRHDRDIRVRSSYTPRPHSDHSIRTRSSFVPRIIHRNNDAPRVIQRSHTGPQIRLRSDSAARTHHRSRDASRHHNRRPPSSIRGRR